MTYTGSYLRGFTEYRYHMEENDGITDFSFLVVGTTRGKLVAEWNGKQWEKVPETKDEINVVMELIGRFGK